MVAAEALVVEVPEAVALVQALQGQAQVLPQELELESELELLRGPELGQELQILVRLLTHQLDQEPALGLLKASVSPHKQQTLQELV